jgi:hypothetical protein
MNDIIRFRTTPNVRHLVKGILLAKKLNEHLKWKIEKQKKKELEELYDIELISSDEETPLLKK